MVTYEELQHILQVASQNYESEHKKIALNANSPATLLEENDQFIDPNTLMTLTGILVSIVRSIMTLYKKYQKKRVLELSLLVAHQWVDKNLLPTDQKRAHDKINKQVQKLVDEAFSSRKAMCFPFC